MSIIWGNIISNLLRTVLTNETTIYIHILCDNLVGHCEVEGVLFTYVGLDCVTKVLSKSWYTDLDVSL
jgi:hypothetical protein